jgi:hypothetical protein
MIQLPLLEVMICEFHWQAIEKRRPMGRSSWSYTLLLKE